MELHNLLINLKIKPKAPNKQTISCEVPKLSWNRIISNKYQTNLQKLQVSLWHPNIVFKVNLECMSHPLQVITMLTINLDCLITSTILLLMRTMQDQIEYLFIVTQQFQVVNLEIVPKCSCSAGKLINRIQMVQRLF